MYLSDKSIQEYIQLGKIIIQPEYNLDDIQAAGIRVHLDDKVLVPKPDQTIDLQHPSNIEYDEHSLKEQPYTITPGKFILASTIERVHLDRSLVGFIDGRSTMARLGLTMHLSSTIIDGNYTEPRATTLEIKNLGNFSIVLNYKDPVGMMAFAQMKDLVAQDPRSQYQGQDGATPPNLIDSKPQA